MSNVNLDFMLKNDVISECLCREISELSALKYTGSPTTTFGDDGYNIIFALKTNNMFIAIQIATKNKGA